MDFSRLNTNRVLVGAIASALLIISILFLPWYSLAPNAQRVASDPDTWICGVGDTSCTGFETFPILRWLLLLAAAAPLILAYILVRGHKLSYPPGEMTMIAGFAATVLILYNGIIDKPGAELAEIDISMGIGYWVALLATVVIAGSGVARVTASQKGNLRKTPGTV